MTAAKDILPGQTVVAMVLAAEDPVTVAPLALADEEVA